MLRKIYFTASLIEEIEDPEDYDYGVLDEFDTWEDIDWDNVGRPIDRLQDLGWKIEDTYVEKLED